MAMEMDSHQFGGDWANDTYVALNQQDLHADKWSLFGSNSPSNNPSSSSFTIPPSLLTQGSVERFGQVTPPEEHSPPRDARETSIPLEELRNEALFPDHQLQALQDFQPKQPPHQQHQPTPSSHSSSPPPPTTATKPSSSSSSSSSSTTKRSAPQNEERAAPKRRRTSKNVHTNAGQSQSPPAPTANQSPAADPSPPTHPSSEPTTTATATAASNPQPPKRKRGRPKSQPQMVEAFTADGFPFQVSSARQSHLEKNRVAAHKCRQRKKEYIGSLEYRAREHAAKNKALKENIAMLREELLELKNEVLRHAGCGFWAVDEYLTRCAGDLLGMQAPGGSNSLTYDAATADRMQQTNLSTTTTTNSNNDTLHSPHSHGQISQPQSPVIGGTSDLEPADMTMLRASSIDSLFSHSPGTDSLDSDDFAGFDMLRDFDEEDES